MNEKLRIAAKLLELMTLYKDAGIYDISLLMNEYNGLIDQYNLPLVKVDIELSPISDFIAK